jgi:hypothetical protein
MKALRTEATASPGESPDGNGDPSTADAAPVHTSATSPADPEADPGVGTAGDGPARLPNEGADVTGPRWAVLTFLLVVLAVAAIGLVKSCGLSLGTASHPGGGVYPLVTFSLLCLAALAGLVRTLLGWSAWPARPASDVDAQRLRVAVALGGAILYTIFLQDLGDVIAGFLVCCIAAWAARPRSWWIPPVSAAILAFAVHELFVEVLQVPLPIGLWPY